MWDSFLQSMRDATLSDWIWHIVAIVFAIYFTVPGLWWPHVEKYMKKRREKEQAQQQQLAQEQQEQSVSNGK